MSDIHIQFVGWNNEAGHDKIWGYFTVGDSSTVFVFYGGRLQSQTLKQHGFNHKLASLRQSKICKGYKEISTDELRKIFPDCESQLDSKLLFAILSENKYKAAS